MKTHKIIVVESIMENDNCTKEEANRKAQQILDGLNASGYIILPNMSMINEPGLTICKNCSAEFLPSLVASVKDMCHPCIMANL